MILLRVLYTSQQHIGPQTIRSHIVKLAKESDFPDATTGAINQQKEKYKIKRPTKTIKMKKNSTIVLVTLIVTCIVSGCKKDSVVLKPTCRIITASGGSGQLNFSYDSEGRLASTSSGALTVSIAYNGNTVITNTRKNDVFYEKKIITLNSNGLASNARIETDIAGTNWENYLYEYSGSEVIKQTYTTSADPMPVVSTLTWSGGNLVAITTPTSTTTLDYYKDKTAQEGDYLLLQQLQSGYQILRNKNLVKSVLSGSNISSFDYAIDADGKITSMTLQGSSSGTYTYQHQCN